jgi:hypothetical protein
MQTDDILILGDDNFSALEESELVKASFMAKPKQKLNSDKPLIFNGCILSLDHNGSLQLHQKGQGKKITLIDTTSNTTSQKQSYVKQRARGAYLTSICQPEASYDLSVAAQYQEPTPEDVTALNKRLA